MPTIRAAASTCLLPGLTAAVVPQHRLCRPFPHPSLLGRPPPQHSDLFVVRSSSTSASTTRRRRDEHANNYLRGESCRCLANGPAAAAAATEAEHLSCAGSAGYKPRVVVVGGGNAAHVAVGMFARQGADVGMFVSFPEEAKEIRAGVAANGGLTVRVPSTAGPSSNSSYKVQPGVISSNPAEVIPGADMVVIIAPAFAHEALLRQIEPYVHHKVFVGAIPAPGGFQWMAEHILRDSAAGLTVFGGDHLPWACRVVEKGKSVSLLGVESHANVCTQRNGRNAELLDTLNRLFDGTTYSNGSHFLNCTLFPANCILHPGIMYGLWKDWDGEPLDKAPVFYRGISQVTADVLQGLSDDIQATKNKLETELGIDLSSILPLYDYQVDVYRHSISDTSSLRSVFTSNRAYHGLTCPMVPAPDAPGKLLPDFHSRYLTEDLPHGLAVLKGVAEIAGVDTPHFDAVLSWGQQKVGAVYMVDGKIDATSPDVAHSGCPQRWGYCEIEDLRGSARHADLGAL